VVSEWVVRETAKTVVFAEMELLELLRAIGSFAFCCFNKVLLLWRHCRIIGFDDV
jgi:hypothetical protein